MQLIVSADQRDGAPATAEAVCQAIDTIQYDPSGFVILEREDEHYMQAATKGGSFILEKREGSEATHFVAKRWDGTGDRFSAEEVTEALLGFLGGQPETPGVRWVLL